MIIELRNKQPFIHFGFFEVSKTIPVGQSIDVWLQTLYLEKAYEFEISASTPSEQMSAYQYRFSPPAGTYKIKLFVYLIDKANPKTLESNTIILTVE